jgi:hypothetical protein
MCGGSLRRSAFLNQPGLVFEGIYYGAKNILKHVAMSEFRGCNVRLVLPCHDMIEGEFWPLAMSSIVSRVEMCLKCPIVKQLKGNIVAFQERQARQRNVDSRAKRLDFMTLQARHKTKKGRPILLVFVCLPVTAEDLEPGRW